MAVNLRKGQKVDLTKANPSLKKITVGLGWDVNQYDSGGDFDLDSSAFLLGANGKVRKDSDFIFYGNLQSDDGAVTHTGDSLEGGSGGHPEDRHHGDHLRSPGTRPELRPGLQRVRAGRSPFQRERHRRQGRTSV